VTGTTLSIVISEPRGFHSDPVAQDIVDAERLAFSQHHGSVTHFHVRMLIVRSEKPSNNARTAISEQSTIAYLGELDPGYSEQSLGINNALDVLQVSPTDTALELGQETSAVPGAPRSFFESYSSYGRTFARVVPTSAQEAKAIVDEISSLGVHKLYISDDGSNYGKAIAQAVRTDAGSASLTVSTSEFGSDGMFYGAQAPRKAATFFNAAVKAAPGAKLFGSSSLDTPAFTSALSSGVHRLYVSTPGFMPSALNSDGKAFRSEFAAAYHHQPATQAIFGFEAMSAVLHVLTEAGASANQRGVVVHDFLGIRNRPSALGTYSIGSNGNTSLDAFVFNRLSDGSLTPFKAAPAQG
jgi:ABC-type branched-subunit amino acid transport system substrate-binding protein